MFSCSKEAVEKTGRLKKKIHEKTWVQSDFTAILLNFFLKKNRKKKNFVEKFFFLKVVISFLNMARKKSFFFEKFSGGIFRPNFRVQYFGQETVKKSKKYFFSFFYSLFIVF